MQRRRGNNDQVIRRFTILGAVLAALVVGDMSARAYVETKATERAQLEAPPGSTVSASIGGFPFIPPLLLGGKVSRVGVHIETVKAGPVVFAAVDLKLRGVELDRNRLLQDRKVKIVDIDSGTIDVTITQQALNNVLPIAVTIADGAITAGRLDLTPAISRDGKLTFTALGRTIPPIQLPKLDYVPCFGEITVLAGRLRLSCEIDEVPAALVDAVNNAS